ncbi:TPM domain-containing protein [Mangrovibacterium diazotrophicum]|uniref:TLP18.3/Psb32/MOLO-1 phosphatase superfamily protein n=1 Tax=Mangrovibacterium diazotrophicum TaxID=1261403 RepID=A0A419VX09_9BACT|nr:TPM domain-containing protein [Mangrovibacterium diazotrophicum]RKD87757.1 TLP18.3/Psb32/MOLO-1 phosphatase superfamily protein [Mangrovibacterium diazotrophicum]
MAVVDFFTEQEKKQITDAIKAAELKTSGEIRVHVEGRCKEDVLDCAAHWFEQLKMHKTAARNGVLFYLAVTDRKFAILGDAGINAKVPDNFWESTKDLMLSHFKKGRFADGLSEGILMAGKQLKEHFPYQKDDVNELSDDISFGKK